MVKRSEEIEFFFKHKQPKCSYKRLITSIINGYTVKLFVCSKNDRKCNFKNCKQHGE